MAIKRDIAEKLMSGKGNLNSSSFSVIPDGYLGLVENGSGRHLAVVCGEKSEWNKAWKGGLGRKQQRPSPGSGLR